MTSTVSKDASVEAAGSTASSKQIQQESFFDHENKSKEVIHASTVAFETASKLNFSTLPGLSSETLQLKHVGTSYCICVLGKMKQGLLGSLQIMSMCY